MVATVQSADGTTISYECTGTGPALVLCGGAFSTRRSFDGLVALLSGKFSVYAYDRRGRGDSGNTAPYAVAREVEDLSALIGAVGEPAYVYGHSSGAILALEAAAAGPPLAKLAFYEPSYLAADGHDKSEESWEAFNARLQSALDEGHPDLASELFIRRTGAPFDDSITQTPWWPAMVAVAHTLPYDIVISGDGTVPSARLAKITAKTLGIFGGASDAWAGAAVAAVAGVIRGASQEVVEGQGHGVAHEAVAPVLIDFFS